MSGSGWHDPRGAAVPSVTADQMREVDRLMVEELGIGLLQMMEHAGRHVAGLARRRFLHGDPQGTRIMVLAGTGGNGGGALVAARRLHAWGARVRVVTSTPPDTLKGALRQHADTLARLEVPLQDWSEAMALRNPDLVVDGIIGYSLWGAPRGPAAQMIRWTNGLSAPVLSLDVPSGLDPTRGTPSDPTVLAAATLTLALPKSGLRNPQAEAYLGELYLGDIGVPPNLYGRIGLEVPPLFAREDVLRLR